MFNDNILREIEEKLNLSWKDIFSKYVKDTLQRKWNTYYICCPFHWENTASFWISFDKKIMKCFWCWKSFSSILQFIKEYQSISQYWLLEKLQQDWIVTDIKSLLWEDQYEKYINSDVKKNIFKTIEKWERYLKKDIFQRILFDKWWIWLITQEKYQNIEALIEKKYSWKKEKEKKELKEEYQKSIWSYWLISNEYESIEFYFVWKKSIKEKADDEASNTKIHYVYNDSPDQKIKDIQKNNTLINLFIRNDDKQWLQNWKNWFISELSSQKTWFKEHIENKFRKDLVQNNKYDSNDYYNFILDLLYFKESSIQYVISEWFFDVYSMWLYQVPYYTAWSWIWSYALYNFIQYVSKKSLLWDFNSTINLFFDNDKAWYLATINFVNQYFKYNQLKKRDFISKNSDINVRIFDFEMFSNWLKKLFTILITYTKKQNLWELEWKIIELKKKINNEYYDAFFSYDLIETWFSKVFENVITNHWILNTIKSKFWWNYKEDSKTNNTIKDLWELPEFIKALYSFLIIIWRLLEEWWYDTEYFEAFKQSVMWEFKNIYLKSFRTVQEFKSWISWKINSWFITFQEYNNKIKFENYIDWNWLVKKANSNTEIALKESFSTLYKEIDVESDALKTLNLLCYSEEIKKNNILLWGNDLLKSIRKTIRWNLENNYLAIIKMFLDKSEVIFRKMNSEKIIEKKEDYWIELRQIQNKIFYFINILFEFKLIENKEELLWELLKEYNLPQEMIQDLLKWNYAIVNHTQMINITQSFEKYEEVKDILKDKIISEITSFWVCDIFLDQEIFWQSLIYLINRTKSK